MRIKVQSDDGQDFACEVGGYGGGIRIGVACLDQNLQLVMVNFSADEVRGIVAVLQHAISEAEMEMDLMEKRNGN
jgi:hypothetical protein